MGNAAGGTAAPSRRRRLSLYPLLPLLTVACADMTAPGTVLFASGADLQSINPLVTVHPLAKQVQKHVLLLTLAGQDSSLLPIPRLASWIWSADRRQLTFHLRHDVRWHDGVPTTAADVVWTLRHAMDPAVAYPRARDLADVQAVIQRDSLTVVVEWGSPQPMFPDVFTDLPVLPAHRFTGVSPAELRTAPFNEQPVGNGPYAFVEHRPNQRWVFRRAPSFPQDLGSPAVERLVIAVVDEPTTKLAALTSGELDFAGINPAHAAFVRNDQRLRVVDYPVLFSYALVFNLRRPPFEDARVRRALALAIDRQLIVEAYLYGFGTPAAGPVPPEHPWYAPVPPVPYAPDSAATLLERAGWTLGADGVRRRDGVPLAFDMVTVGSGDMALEQMLQAQLAAVGAAVGLRQLELTTFLATVQGERRDFDALVTGIPGDLALSYVGAMFDGDGPLAYPGYRDAALDSALRATRHARTGTAVADAWRQVQRLLAAAHATAWIYHARGVQGVSRRVRGVSIDLRGELAGIAAWRLEGERQ